MSLGHDSLCLQYAFGTGHGSGNEIMRKEKQ
jgi:hypothetical protein